MFHYPGSELYTFRTLDRLGPQSLGGNIINVLKAQHAKNEMSAEQQYETHMNLLLYIYSKHLH